MCGWWIVVAAALVMPLAVVGQETSVLRVRVTLTDAAGQPTPIPRHGLLISDNPATAGPRLMRTGADGTLEVRLAPGSYAVESERAVMFEGQAFEWFHYLDLAAGQTITLDLTRDNAEAAEPVPSSDDATAPPDTDPILVVGRWQTSVVEIWSPTARATGFVVDASGLIATDREAIGDAQTVAVQLSPTVKVEGRVLPADATRAVAVVRVDPAAAGERPPVPLDCPPTRLAPVRAGERILAITAEMGRPSGVTEGEVISPGPPRLATNLRTSLAGAGGPVFDEAGAVLGITAIRRDPDNPRWHEVEVVPAVRVCEALHEARLAATGAAPPPATRLPVEPRPFPASLLERASGTGAAASPITATSEDFEIAFVTPPAIHQARQKADWTGGRGARAPEAEARLGRVTDFGAWSDYFADAPAVVVVRATPKMVEGFWKRVAREAARTQGAELPPFKAFKTSFVRMTLACGPAAIAPIHPFVLDHQLSEAKVIREGLYVFDPAAFDPGCGELRLTLFSDRAPDTPDTIVIPRPTVERIRSDFAAWSEQPGV